MAITGPNAVMYAMIGTSPNIDRRVPSEMSRTTASLRPATPLSASRGLMAVRSVTPMTPYGTCSSSQKVW